MKYKAFISYSHAEDGKFAPGLQSGLHKFNRPWYRLRAIRVFRDDTNLSLTPGLWSSIQEALETSEYFLLLASPQASESEWVKKEVDFWLKHSSPQKLLIVLTDGEVFWDNEFQNFDWNRTTALPKNLDGIFPEEPLFLDMRANKTKLELSLDHPKFLDNIASLGAKLHGRAKNDLIGEDVAQHKKVRRIAWSVGIALMVLTLASIVAAFLAIRKEIESHSLALTANAQKAKGSKDNDLAIALSLEANKILLTSKMEHDSNVLAEVKDTLTSVAYLSPGTRLVYKGHTDKVTSVSVSPDGHYGLSGSEDKTIRIWELETGKEVKRLLGHSGKVTSVAFSPDGRKALSGSTDKTVRLWDIQTGRVVQSFDGHTHDATGVAFEPNGRRILSGGGGGSVRLWNVATGTQIKQFTDDRYPISSVAFSPDGTKALSGNANGKVCLWDLNSLEKIRCEKAQDYSVHSVTFSPDGQTALSGAGGWDRGILLWTIQNGGFPITNKNSEKTFDRQEGGHLSLAYSPDGLTALSGSSNNDIFLWDLNAGPNFGKVLDRFIGHTGGVKSVVFSPNGQTFLSGSADHTLRLWQISGSAEVKKWDKEKPAPMALSPNGHTVFVGVDVKTNLLELDIHTGDQINRFHSPLGWRNLFSIAISPNGSTALLGSSDGQVHLLDLNEKKTTRLLGTHNGGGINDIAFSPDGTKALSASYGQKEDEYLILWDMDTGKVLKRLIGHTEVVRNVAISPDGHFGLSGSADEIAILWDLERGTEISRFKGHIGDVFDVAFTIDGKSVVTASKDRSLRLWDIKTNETIRKFTGHAGEVNTVAISPDGRTMVSGGTDNTIKLWELDTGEEIANFSGHTGQVIDISYTRDGRNILSLSWDGTMRLWKMAGPDNLMEWTHANRHVRALSCDEKKRYRINQTC